MSHTIGQTKEDNHQSNSNSNQSQSDSSSAEESSVKPTALLSDKDYEFLFNQLLEGVAHGWHERRINKFFQQLEERGQQQDWIAWLERVRLKLLKAPLESRRQIGTLMIRLGELTRAVTEISQIGAASHRIGRELLFGNTAAIIWEYDGPDLNPSEVLGMETEQELADRLPTDFTDLQTDSTPVNQPEYEPAEVPIADEPEYEPAEIPVADEPEYEPAEIPVADEPEYEPAEVPVADELASIQAAAISDDLASSTSNTVAINNQELSAEIASMSSLDEPVARTNLEPGTTEPEIVESAIIVPEEQQSRSAPAMNPESPDTSEQISLLAEAIDAFEAPESDPESPPVDQAPSEKQEVEQTAIDINQVMHLIQEDQELAQQISQKLDRANLPAPLASAEAELSELDDSSLELVESWFNLGLKQVSAGEFSQAIASWEKALNINPNLSEAWHNRGSALGRLGNYEAAVDSFQSALTIDPHNYQAWNDRAHALYQLQNWDEAVSSWSNAIKIMPGNHLFWYNRGCALEQLEQWQEAIASYEKALEIKPDFQPGRTRYINLVADNSRAN